MSLKTVNLTNLKRDWCWTGLDNESWDNWISCHLYLQEVGGSSRGLLPVKLDYSRVPTHLYHIQMTQRRGGCPIPFAIVSKWPNEEESTDAKTTSCPLMHLLKSLLWELIDSNQGNLGAGKHSVIHFTGPYVVQTFPYVIIDRSHMMTSHSFIQSGLNSVRSIVITVDFHRHRNSLLMSAKTLLGSITIVAAEKLSHHSSSSAIIFCSKSKYNEP